MKFGKLKSAMTRMKVASLLSALVLVGAGMAPGTALAHGPVRTGLIHYGITAYGYQLISVETFFCDGDYQLSPFLSGQITYTETQNFDC